MTRRVRVKWTVVVLLLAFPPARADEEKHVISSTEVSDGPFRLQLIDGRTEDISLSEIKDGQITGRESGRDVVIPIEDILRLTVAVGESASARTPSGHHFFYFCDGGLVAGDLTSQTPAMAAAAKMHIGLIDPVDVRFSALSGMRVAATELPEIEKVFQERMADRKQGRDTMILVKEGKPVVLQGSLEKLSATGWEFSFGNKTRTGALESVYAFVFGAPAAAIAASEAMIQLTDGNRFGGRIQHANAESMTVETNFGGALDVPWNSVRMVDFQSARVAYLSNLKPSKTEQRSMPGAVWPARMDLSVTGGPLRLGGRTFGRGVGVHAYSSLTYELGGGFERFSAVVGVDDSVGLTGSVVFRVMGDGRKLYESRVLRGGDAPVGISVDLTGVGNMTLECDTADELDLSDHADWANAILIRAKVVGK